MTDQHREEPDVPDADAALTDDEIAEVAGGNRFQHARQQRNWQRQQNEIRLGPVEQHQD
jgi:hypothetical protein